MIIYPSTVVNDSLSNERMHCMRFCRYDFPGSASTQCLAEERYLSNV